MALPNPFHRVSTEQGDAHVVVRHDGTVLADSRSPVLLHETGLPVRYYLPREDVRLELLEPSATRTRCPWKGEASYWSARVGDTLLEDVVWSYEQPIDDVPEIKGLLCFYTERLDTVVDTGAQDG
jgi:uncharacterized protein (DUF427 family)